MEKIYLKPEIPLPNWLDPDKRALKEYKIEFYY